MEFEELEDIFKTEAFKSLSWKHRVWLRIKVAFFQFLSYY